MNHCKFYCVSSWNLSKSFYTNGEITFHQIPHFMELSLIVSFKVFISKQETFFENGNIEKGFLLCYVEIIWYCWYSYILEHLRESTSATPSRTATDLNTCSNRNNNNINIKISSLTSNVDHNCFFKSFKLTFTL